MGKDEALRSMLPALQGQCCAVFTYPTALLSDEDEIMAALAEQISSFPEYIGQENSVSLLALLEVRISCSDNLFQPLCKAEETVVRNKATSSTESICQFLTDDQIQTTFVPMLKRLASEEWFTPKSSACNIFHIGFSRSSQEVQLELIAIYKSLCTDETPMVRRAAANHLKVWLVASIK